MNERIKVLTEQAGFIHFASDEDCDTPVDVSKRLIDWSCDYTEELEKFAELIVQECIRLCDQVDLAGADDCIDNIKDYFEIQK